MQGVEYHSSKSLIPTYKLSVRELEVLKLMVEGQSNPEIAAHLYLTHTLLKLMYVASLTSLELIIVYRLL